MQKGFTKGLKPLLIKQIAVLMGVCYLLNPLHQQIEMVLHDISHGMEIPDFVLSHSTNSNDANEAHHYKEHGIDEIEHDHHLIDLINSVLAASSEKGDSENSTLFELKIDKHISTFQIQLDTHFTIQTQQSFWTLQEDLELGYFEKIKRPPQYQIA